MQTIEIPVGDLYAQLHERYVDGELNEQYLAKLREENEELIHNFNQTVERQLEQAEQAEQSGESDETAE